MRNLATRGRFCLLLFTFSLSLGIAGCFGGAKEDYRGLGGRPAYPGHSAIAVLAFDQRHYVLNGQKEPTFVGLQRGSDGKMTDVITRSGQQLASEITDAFTRSLAAAGFAARSVPYIFTEDSTLEDARATLLRGHARRALFIRIDQWESTTAKRSTLEYEFDASVFDAAGKLLANTHSVGTQPLAAGANSHEAAPAALPGKINALLNAAVIRMALQS